MKTLTNGQIDVLISLVEQNIIDRQKHAKSINMAIDPSWEAYQKRLITSLARAKS